MQACGRRLDCHRAVRVAASALQSAANDAVVAVGVRRKQTHSLRRAPAATATRSVRRPTFSRAMRCGSSASLAPCAPRMYVRLAMWQSARARGRRCRCRHRARRIRAVRHSSARRIRRSRRCRRGRRVAARPKREGPDGRRDARARLRESAAMSAGGNRLETPGERAVRRTAQARLARAACSPPRGCASSMLVLAIPDCCSRWCSRWSSGSASAATAPVEYARSRSISSTDRPAASANPAFRTGSSRRCRRSAPSTCRAEAMRRSDSSTSQDHDLPVGMSKRNHQGIDRTFLNCAVCHVEHRARRAEAQAAHLPRHARETLQHLSASRTSSSTCAQGSASFSKEFIVPEIGALIEARGEKLGPARPLPRLSGCDLR